MAIIRQKRKKRFSIIDNQLIEDKRLTWGARGLLEYMLSKPDDWKFYMSELITHSDNDGRDKTYGYLKELKKYGYVIRKQNRNSKGKFAAQDLIVTDIPVISPHTDFPDTDKPDTGSPDTVNPTLPNTDFKPNTDGLPNNDLSSSGDGGKRPQLIQIYRKGTGENCNPMIEDRICQLADYYTDEKVSYALKLSFENNATSPLPYTEALLQKWIGKGWLTMDLIKEHERRADINQKDAFGETLPF